MNAETSELLKPLEDSFKPETRKSGDDIFAKDVVSISSGSDTQIQAYVRVSGSPRVNLCAQSISSSEVTANCTCTASTQKSQLCKHMWAVLLKTAEKYPDFLESKTRVEKAAPKAADAGGPSSTAGASSRPLSARPAYVKPPPSEAQIARAEAMKAKQAEYRKAQYQKSKERQKERLKDSQTGKKSGYFVKAVPPEVESAFHFFLENGFDFKESLNEEDLSNARKKLSRIFHPDKGGSHEEALTLNENYMILEGYLHSK